MFLNIDSNIISCIFFFFYSGTSSQKSWIGPEVRGTVGLPWPASLESFNPQLPHNNYNSLAENLNRRPSHDSSFNYSRHPYNSTSEPNRTPHTNSNAMGSNSNIYQTNSHINNTSVLNYPGTPSHHQRTPVRTPSNNGIDHNNGNCNNNSINSSYDNLSRQQHQNLHQQQQFRREQGSMSWNKMNGGSNFQNKYNPQQSSVETPSSDSSKQKLLVGSSNSSSTSSVLSNSNMSCSRSRSTLSVAEQNSVSSTSYHNQHQNLSSSKMSTSSSSQSHLLFVNSPSAGGSSVSCNSGNDAKWTSDEASSNTGQMQPGSNSTKPSWGPLYHHKSSSDVENAVSI